MNAICSKFEVLSAKDDGALADEIHALRQLITEQTSKPQHKKVIYDLTTKTWCLVEVSTVLFFCMSLLTTKICDQSKEIDELELAGWKYRALRATLPANNANVIWLERNIWTGNKEGIRHCRQFVINYEDSIRRRYEMEQEAAMRDSIGRLMIQQSKDIRKKMKWSKLLTILLTYICQRGSCRQLDGNPIMDGSIDGLRSNSSFKSPTKVLFASIAFSQ